MNAFFYMAQGEADRRQKNMRTVSFECDFGINDAEGTSLSPDTLVQLAIQYACYKTYGEYPNVGEPINLRSKDKQRLDFVGVSNRFNKEFLQDWLKKRCNC